MRRPVRIGLLGCGVVGQGVLRMLHAQRDGIARRLGAPIEVAAIVVRDLGRARGPHVAGARVVGDPDVVLEDPTIEVVLELMGGLEPAGDYVARALCAGKSVVTANKHLLAERGPELAALAAAHGVQLAYEAAVCGGIPVIRVMREALTGDRVIALRGIINGTSNYILTRMQDAGLELGAALAEAQAAGYAEADPQLDLNGGDAAHKLVILARLAFGAQVTDADVPREGIEAIEAVDIAMASRFGFVVKLLAVADRKADGALALGVHPTLVPRGSGLANVGGVLNAIELVGEGLGPCLLSGRGAGALPTAVSVVGDLVDVARERQLGAFEPSAFVVDGAPTRIALPGEHVGPFYLRFSVCDRPGVLAAIAGALGRSGVSIHQMVQEGRAQEGDALVHVVMITHACKEDDLQRALGEIASLEGVARPARAIRIEEDRCRSGT